MLKEIMNTGYVTMVDCGHCKGDCAQCHEPTKQYVYADVQDALNHGWRFLTMEDGQRYHYYHKEDGSNG